jgi:hypothetical protein
VIAARPRWTEWLSILLWPPVCLYASYIGVAILSGVPQKPSDPAWGAVWERTLWVAAVMTPLVIGWTIWTLLSRGFWFLDEEGIRRGVIGEVRVPWSEIESLVIGMPPRLHAFVRVLRQVPTASVQASVGRIQSLRDQAFVLRLSGRRLLAVNLFGRHHQQGTAFMEALRAQMADRIAPASSYTSEEIEALARIRVGLIQL